MGASAARWTELVSHRHRQPGGPGRGGPGRMAENLREAGRRDMTRTPVYQAVVEALGPERTVLDIGAGPGRYTLPLARAGCRVWALEPSDVGRGYLREDAAQLPPEAAAAITVLAETWPDGRAAVPPVEVALASLVIHFCPDAAGFLTAMEAAASRRCVLAIRVGQMQPLLATLWPIFHPEEPLPRQPVLADLLAVMDELGIRPEVHRHQAMRAYGRYASREEARDHLVAALHLEGAPALERLDAELAGRLVPTDDGGWRAAEGVQEAVVTWRPRRPL